MSNTVEMARMLSVTPPLRKLSKKPGPTCRPIMKTNRINPKSCKKVMMLIGAVRPRCPARIPANNTNVTPRATFPNLIFPNKTPMAITMAYNMAIWATESVAVKRLINQSILFFSLLLWCKISEKVAHLRIFVQIFFPPYPLFTFFK